MEALGEEAGWKREDEGGQAMESLGTGARGGQGSALTWRGTCDLQEDEGEL